MKLRKYLHILGIAFIILFVMCSCKKSAKEIEAAYLSSAIAKLNVGDTIKWIVILPGLGCHGCIQEAEAFMKDQIKNKEILFVLTKISSLKILQQKINVNLKDHPNVYTDREDIFSIPTDNSIYPCITRVENGKVITHEFQSPKNGAAFRKLKGLVLAQ